MSIMAEIPADVSVNRLEQPMAHLQSIANSPINTAELREDDFALLRRYAGFGDPQAFAQIVQRYAGFVYATCLRVIGDGSRAEDLSQETFFRLMRRPHEVRQNLGGWLHRTATHLALDSLRSETSRRRREIVYSTQCDHEASSWAELSPSVDQALSDMPEELRTLLVEHFLLGKSQAQLAAETEQSASTISRRMHQALDELREHLRLKGVYALPAVLAGLLCHVAARQAPASLVRELGKMTMFSGATAASRAAQFGSPNPLRNPPSPKLMSRMVSPPTILALVGMIGALILLQLLGCLWGSGAARPASPEDQPHLKSSHASAMVIWGDELFRPESLQKAP
ncbi:MAG TPA: sigma-70 family RNA polymerase sigma factor [Tepidisphaeraceae bacterium]|jgi:RNA polymerase sigma factor (sigma-70 family)|nr:sigma-70 family RNA polymerase sigma factor [Tepidisphaeraceae bacterium]